MKLVAFVGGMVFDSATETFKRANILCTDGYITDITEEMPSFDYERVQLNGKYVIPGLVDVHTHGICGNDFNYADEKEVARMCLEYARAGTTSLLATLASGTMSSLLNSIFNINQNRLNEANDKATILGVHLEGRYLNPQMRGCHPSELLALPDTTELTSLASAMMPAPLHFSIAPELSGADEFIKMAKDLGASIGIAHTKASYEEAREAISIGASSFTHTFNAMTPVHHRMPGVAICSLTSDDAYTEIICDGEHIHPAMIKLAYKAKPKDKLVLVTDSMSATNSPDGEYKVAGVPVIVKNGRATDKNGVLAGSTLTMIKALKNFMSFCGISLSRAIKYATINPAKMVGAEFVGKIESNYRADLLIINDTKNLEIDSVYVGANKIN